MTEHSIEPPTSQPQLIPSDKLAQMLAEDFDGDDANTLYETVQRLQTWRAPEPDAASGARLLIQLQAALPARKTRFAIIRQRFADWPPLLLMQTQLRVVQGEIWIASALVMTLGVLVTLALLGTPHAPGLEIPFVLIAPIAAACGVSFLYGMRNDAALEIENTLPISASLVLLTRLALVFGFDCALGVIGSVALTLITPDLSLWPLVGAWLAPMAFLSAVTFLSSVLFVDPVAGILISLALWALQVAVRFWHVNAGAGFAMLLHALPDLLAADMRPWLVIGSVVLIGFALWLVSREEMLLRGLNR